MRKKLAVFAFDICEISQIRRIEGFLRIGHEVTSYSMRRKNMNADFEPHWPDVHLFETKNERPLRRIIAIICSWFKVSFHLKSIAQSEILIARNFDMLLIALGVKFLLHISHWHRHIPLVYECLDIHSYFCANGLRGKFSRFVERLALRYVRRIVVSSPAFERQYFRELQKYFGEIVLIENKLAVTDIPRPKVKSPIAGPVKIGLVGTIRCAPSVQLLLGLARQYPNAIEIHFHGIVHTHSLPNFDLDIKNHGNVFFHGPYNYFSDLPQIYQNLNYVWAQDLWQTNGNSMWLLPNRIYEAGYFGCPSIALIQSETGHKILNSAWGITVTDAHFETLYQSLQMIGKVEYATICAGVLQKPELDFTLNDLELNAFFGGNEASN